MEASKMMRNIQGWFDVGMCTRRREKLSIKGIGKSEFPFAKYSSVPEPKIIVA